MKNKKLIVVAVALVAVVAVLLGVFFATRPGTQEGMKEFTVTVVHADGTEKVFPCESSEEYLGKALVAEEIVVDNQGEYGLYILEVDGEIASWEENGAYWSVYVGDEPATVGADQIPLTDGGQYSVVYTLG